MFVDAAAIIAIIVGEADGQRCAAAIDEADSCITSPIAIWEASIGLSRPDKLNIPKSQSQVLVMNLLTDRGVDIVDLPPGAEATQLAVDASERYGHGKRRLNLADCFHYACAKHYGVPILSTADEFRLTDLEVVA